MRNIFVISLIIIALALGGCTRGNENRAAGTAVGAGLGALLGSTIGEGSGRDFAIAGGALLGALAGSEIGSRLDERDRLLQRQAAQEARVAPIGEEITWRNPDTGNAGSYTPVREGRTGSGRYCRMFEQEIMVDGRRETAEGVACQRGDGSWEVMN